MPEVNKIAAEKRIHPWFDYVTHQLISKRKAVEKNGSTTKPPQNKVKYQNIDKA